LLTEEDVCCARHRSTNLGQPPVPLLLQLFHVDPFLHVFVGLEEFNAVWTERPQRADQVTELGRANISGEIHLAVLLHALHCVELQLYLKVGGLVTLCLLAGVWVNEESIH
jgi:hypothetical protein